MLILNIFYAMHSNVYWILLGSGIFMQMSNNVVFSSLIFFWLIACGYILYETAMEDPREDKIEVVKEMIFKGDEPEEGDDSEENKK